MTSDRAWAQELQKRCEAVGWTVALGRGGHWKARTPQGQTLVWPNTPGDVRTRRNVMRDARRLGLEDLERDLALEKERDRLARIERDRERGGVPAAHFLAPPEPNPELTPEAAQPNPESENAMRNSSPGRGFVVVDGQRLGIIEQAEVWFQPSRGGEKRLVEDARELMLIDHSVHYQCLKGTGSFVGAEDAGGATETRCDRLFETPSGVFFHQARTHKVAEAAAAAMQPHPATLEAQEREEAPQQKTPAPAGRDLGGVIPVENPGALARMESLGQRVLDLHYSAQKIADAAWDLHGDLRDCAQELAAEVGGNAEMQTKAAKFDAMLRAAGDLGPR